MSNFSESKESFSSSASELPVKRTETKEINQDGEQDLLKQIQEIKNLPSEAVANRYLFWDSKEAGESKKTLSREKAASVLDLLNETNDFEESIDEEKAKQYLGRFFNKNFSGLNYTVNTLRNWCSENPDNIKIINEEVINALNKGAEVSLPLLYLLSELSMYRQDPLLVDGGKPIENLSNALNNGTFSLMPEFFDQLAVLGRVENKKANLKLHKILDFIRDFMEDCQNFEGGSDNLFDACEKFSAMEKDKSKNYLLKKHFEEISEMRNVVRPDKKDVIKDLTGGATDQVIYTYRNLVESQQNKMRLGINQGFPVRNPVLPISNGIFGLYDKGKLIEIFKDDDVDFSDREKKYIKNNKPEYDYIYKAINKNGNLPRDFEAYEKARNGEFYFDTSRLTDVDPVVLGIILTSNQMYIHAVEGHNNKIELLSKDEFYKELFPLKNYSAEKAYGYEYLLSLSMRKKIEDDFGLKIEELGLAEQRNFLTFLERASVDKAKDL